MRADQNKEAEAKVDIRKGRGARFHQRPTAAGLMSPDALSRRRSQPPDSKYCNTSHAPVGSITFPGS